MGQRTIYVREEHEPLWERAKELAADDSLSNIIAEGLRCFLAEQKRKVGLEHIVARFWYKDTYLLKPFWGRWVLREHQRQIDDDHEYWYVALTARGQYAIWCDRLGPELHKGFWQLVLSLEEAEGLPDDVIRAAANSVQREWLPDLDI